MPVHAIAKTVLRIETVRVFLADFAQMRTFFAFRSSLLLFISTRGIKMSELPKMTGTEIAITLGMKKQIEVWFKTSNGDRPTWCVSLCEANGEKIELLSTHDDREGAVEAAVVAAEERGLKAVERDKQGFIIDL